MKNNDIIFVAILKQIFAIRRYKEISITTLTAMYYNYLNENVRVLTTANMKKPRPDFKKIEDKIKYWVGELQRQEVIKKAGKTYNGRNKYKLI